MVLGGSISELCGPHPRASCTTPEKKKKVLELNILKSYFKSRFYPVYSFIQNLQVG